MHNRVDYIAAGGDIKYSFLCLKNSNPDTDEAWSGLNSEGFSIMNSVSYNIRREGDDTPDSQMDQEGFIMYRALATCATIEDFEKLLDGLNAPFGIEANFGVIDARGGAAYYEVNNFEWVKYDVNDPETAPDGYLIRSNYSFSGREGKGQGYVRYNNAQKNISELLASGGKIDERWVMDCLSRSYYQSYYKMNPYKEGRSFFKDKDFIPRKSTCAVTIVKGVEKGENPANAYMCTALGYPPASVLVPMMVADGKVVNSDMTSSVKSRRSAACDRALKRKERIFFKNNDINYVDLEEVRRLQSQIKTEEDSIFTDFKIRYEEVKVR